MSSIRTQYEDLSKLGLPTTELLKLCQTRRPNTLESDNEIHLNDKFCSERGWYCYNVVLGEPTLVGEVASERKEYTPELIYSCNNEENSNPLCSKSIQTTTSSVTATLSFVKPPVIRLGAQVAVSNVGDSGLLLTLATELGEQTSSIEKFTAADAFTFDVGAYEKVEVYRTKVNNTKAATYELSYGVKGLIGTVGKEYEGKQDISYPAESFNVASTAVLKGTSTDTSYSYKVVRTASKVRPVNCVHVYGEVGCHGPCCRSSGHFSQHGLSHHGHDFRYQREVQSCNDCCAHGREDARLAAEDLRLRNEAAQLKAERNRLSERETQLRLEDTRIRDVDARQHEEDARLRKEDQRLIEKDTVLQAKEELLNQREKQLQDEEDRLKAEAERLAEEDARQKAEATRQAEEETRLKAESSRLIEMETRLKTEEIHIQEETIRIQTEETRIKIEQSKLVQEQTRITEEDARLKAEDARLKAKEEELDKKAQAAEEVKPAVGEKVSETMKTKLDSLGKCPQNYSWTRIEGGYVCSGGGHHIWDKDLEKKS